MITHQVGTHTVQIEGEVLVSRIRGTFTVADAAAYFVLVDRVLAEHGRYFMLMDMSQADAVPAETRRLAAAYGRLPPAGGMAIWGSSVAIRTVFTLVARGVALFRGA